MHLERWWIREKIVLADGRWWPDRLPGLLYQQLYNWAQEENRSFRIREAPERWLRLLRPSGRADQPVRMNFAPGREKNMEFYFSHVMSVAFSPDGTKIVIGQWDGTVSLWDALTGQALGELRQGLENEGNDSPVMFVAFSPDSTKIVTVYGHAWMDERPGYNSGWGQLSDASTLHTLKLYLGLKNPKCAAFSPDGSKILMGDVKWGAPGLFETNSGKLLRVFQGHQRFIRSAAFSPDGTKVLTGSPDKTARVWDVATGRELLKLTHDDSVRTVAFFPDGTKIFTSAKDQTTHIWDVATGRELLKLTHDGSLETLRSLQDGTSVLTSPDGQWHLPYKACRFGSGIIERWGWITSVALSPDGTKILIGDTKGRISLREAEDAQKELAFLRTHGGAVTNIAFSPDGTRILGLEKTAYLWEIEVLQQKPRVGKEPFTFARNVYLNATNWTFPLSIKRADPSTPPNKNLMVMYDKEGKVIYFFRTNGVERGELLGLFVAAYPIESVYWHNATHVLLKDRVGRDRPYSYRLKLEGKW
jgi:WD40 repeat protein